MAQVSILDPRVPQGDSFNVIAKATGVGVRWVIYPFLANVVYVPGYWNRGGIVLPPFFRVRIRLSPEQIIEITFVRWSERTRYYGSPDSTLSILRNYPWPEFRGEYVKDDRRNSFQPFYVSNWRPWRQEFGTVNNTLENAVSYTHLTLPTIYSV